MSACFVCNFMIVVAVSFHSLSLSRCRFFVRFFHLVLHLSAHIVFLHKATSRAQSIKHFGAESNRAESSWHFKYFHFDHIHKTIQCKVQNSFSVSASTFRLYFKLKPWNCVHMDLFDYRDCLYYLKLYCCLAIIIDFERHNWLTLLWTNYIGHVGCCRCCCHQVNWH